MPTLSTTVDTLLTAADNAEAVTALTDILGGAVAEPDRIGVEYMPHQTVVGVIEATPSAGAANRYAGINRMRGGPIRIPSRYLVESGRFEFYGSFQLVVTGGRIPPTTVIGFVSAARVAIDGDFGAMVGMNFEAALNIAPTTKIIQSFTGVGFITFQEDVIDPTLINLTDFDWRSENALLDGVLVADAIAQGDLGFSEHYSSFPIGQDAEIYLVMDLPQTATNLGPMQLNYSLTFIPDPSTL